MEKQKRDYWFGLRIDLSLLKKIKTKHNNNKKQIKEYFKGKEAKTKKRLILKRKKKKNSRKRYQTQNQTKNKRKARRNKQVRILAFYMWHGFSIGSFNS